MRGSDEVDGQPERARMRDALESIKPIGLSDRDGRRAIKRKSKKGKHEHKHNEA